MMNTRSPRCFLGGLAAGAIGATLVLMTDAWSAAPPTPPAVLAQQNSGKLVYATSCAGCHGGGGTGNQGPALVNRGLSFETIRATVQDGRRGTSMPAFKDTLDAQAQADVMAYVLGLTSGDRLPTTVVSAQALASSSQIAAQPVQIGEGRGTPAAGAAVFFDATTLSSCRVCHSYADKGGPVGPDLSTLDRSPLQIYQSISRPKVVSADFPALALTFRDGSHATGIKNAERADALEYFDLSSLPPVKRTVMKPAIAETMQIKDAGIYDHTALPLTKQELLDVSAYLGKSVVLAH